MTGTVQATFNYEEVCELAGCTYRQFDYWHRTNLFAATYLSQGGGLPPITGSGSRRVVDRNELDVITTAVYLIEVGFRLDKAFEYARRAVESREPVVVGVVTIAPKFAVPNPEGNA